MKTAVTDRNATRSTTTAEPSSPGRERLQAQLHAPVLLLTMKMNDEATVARIPEFLRRLRRFAPSPLRATQLASNRSEFCVTAGHLAS